MLRALGHRDVQVYHMNEGHSALLTVALLGRETGVRSLASATREDKEAVRRSCVFTTHTPVAAGHDSFPGDVARQVLGDGMVEALERTRCCMNGELNMTYLALVFSRYVNGVSMRHEDISQDMFPSYPINSITNGVHAGTWTAPPFRRLFDRHIPEWRYDAQYLRYAVSIPLAEIRQAHLEAEQALLAEVERRTGVAMDSRPLTLCFARRATPYKRADLLFSDPDRLRRIASEKGPFQVIFAGKAHPHDGAGKDLIRKIHQAAASLEGAVRVIYLQDYDMALGELLCSGANVWLNNPLKPREASGTSGMKAAMNGVPSLSVLDGWWIEGCVEGVTGWSIGDSWRAESDPGVEIPSLYDKLENMILPLYYADGDGWARVQRSAIALNGSFFNAQRMLVQYLRNAYLPRNGNGS
jgi:starch phosphorylase